MTDIGTAQDLDVGRYSSALGSNSASEALIKQRSSRVYSFRYGGDSAANVNVSETGILEFPYAGYLTNLYIKVDSNVALNTSNYAYINVGIITGGSLSRTNATLATANTASAAMTAHTKTNMTLSSDALRSLSADDCMTIITSKPGGTGVSLPVFTLVAVVRDT